MYFIADGHCLSRESNFVRSGLAPIAPIMSSELATVPLTLVTPGAILSSPIFDYSSPGTKLLGKGVPVSVGLLQQLSSRGVTQVVVSKRDLAAMQAGTPQGTRSKVSDHQYVQAINHTERANEMDDLINQLEFGAEITPSDSPFSDRLGPQNVDAYDPEQMEAAVQQREQQLGYVENLFVDMIDGAIAETDELAGVCRDSLSSIVADRDLFVCLGLNPYDADYPSRHSLHVCAVALSTGVTLGLDDKSLNDLGTGCLIHDVGMMMLDSGIYKAKRRLTQKELALLADHPAHTLDALACPGVRISRIARIVAYQIHERCNGSGYPRGRRAEEIHPLSKIAAVADAYVGLVSNRTHRPGLMPYYAMKKLLESIPQGLFDAKVVRGLLQTVSLFPVGSYVRMDSGKIARVARSMGESYMTPMVEIWNGKHQQFEGELINLSEEPTMKIEGPSRSPTAA